MSHLTYEQRYTIEVLLRKNYTQIEIAKCIDKHKSVVCREVQRNADLRNGVYKADLADRKKTQRHVGKPKKQSFTFAIKTYVNDLLAKDFSPEQIVGYATKTQQAIVSIERIYQHIWADKIAGGTLHLHLRNGRKRYRKRGASKDKRGGITNRVGIENRPVEVELKNRFGDIEVDLIVGKNHKNALITVNDRLTGVVKIVKIENKEAETVSDALIKMMQEWKPYLHTITSDNGKEFAKHELIASSLAIDYFFARPYHSWERGANENLNGLIRQYFTKGSSFENITQERVFEVQEILNNRPRKRFGFESPNYIHSQTINNNGQKLHL